MPNGIMDRFLKKVNQKLTSDNAQCLPTHHYFKGHKFSKPVQKTQYSKEASTVLI